MPIADFPPLLRSSNWKIDALSTARSDRKIKPERSLAKLDQSAEGHKSRTPVERLFGWRQCQWELITNLRPAVGKHSRLKKKHVPSKRKQRMRNHWYFRPFRSLNSWQRPSEYQLQRTPRLQGVHIVSFLFMYSHKEQAERSICPLSRALTNPWSAFEKQAVLRIRCTDISPVSAPRHDSTASRD